MTSLTTLMARAARGGYGDDSDVIGKVAGLLMAAKFDQSGGPFICGTMGAMGPDGLHDGYLICPAYGADIQCTAHFSRAEEARLRSDAVLLEKAIRQGQPPPDPTPSEVDRGQIAARVAATASILAKLSSEHQESERRLSAAVAGIRSAAIAVVTAYLEQEIERLRQMEEDALHFRAGLLKVTEWAGASGTALPLSQAALAVLGSLGPDRDRAKFLGGGAVPRWERLLKRLLEDPTSDFADPVTDTAAQAAE